MTKPKPRIKKTRRHKPIHPGEVLREEFLGPLGISMYRLATDTGMPADRVGRLVKGTRAFSADTALRLARYFGTTPEFWMHLQARYDLEAARDEVGKAIEREVKPQSAA
jgi:addiction module HigA family antidote